MELTHSELARVLDIKTGALHARRRNGDAPQGRKTQWGYVYGSASVESWINAERDEALTEHSKRMKRLSRVIQVPGR